MSGKWIRLFVLAISLLAPVASAEEAFVLVFLEDAPLRHIKVAIDGEIVGVTDGKGLVQASISPGPHKLYLIDDDVAIVILDGLSRDQGTHPSECVAVAP